MLESNLNKGEPVVLRSSVYAAVVCSMILGSGCKSKSSGIKEVVETGGDTECEIAIVGGGVAGLHTAFRLGPKYGSKVCVFEKEARLGGRIFDITKSPNDENVGPYLGAGGRRLMIGQDVVFSLAKELNIELQKPETAADLVFARGMYATNKLDFLKKYPKLSYNASSKDVETDLLQQLLDSPERNHADQYPDFKSYIIKVIGVDGYQYLHDMSRFRGDFEYPLSARSYLDFLAEEMNVCCQTYYPVGGMSTFVRAMAKKAREAGVRLYAAEPVVTIDKDGSGFKIATTKRHVQTQRVIIAVPPVALNRIGGDVPERIKTQQQFQDIIGVKVTVINQWFDKPWWQSVRTSDGKGIWRAYTTGHCISYVEIPPEPYAAAQNAIRTVYNDQRECADMWTKLSEGPQQQLEAELHRGLVHLFANNNVTTPVNIPPASKTVYWEWPEAWYWLRAGTKFSNADIFKWALDPLPNENVTLVNEAYNPQRSAWTDAAYKSSINALNSKYGMNLQTSGLGLTQPTGRGPR